MTARTLSSVLRQIATAGSVGPSDQELLAHVACDGITLLMQRHGPMVWAVCRQMLTDGPDAEDAFQATFLALMQQTPRLRNVRTLGGWLHGVAVKIALKIRRSAARRRKREAKVAKPEGTLQTNSNQWADLHAAVHEELQGLPETLRVPFILCELQGVRPTDAAEQLKWKPGTLSGRLTRARQVLLKRLTARGLAPLVVAGSFGVGEALSRVAVPESLVGPVSLFVQSKLVVPATISTLARWATEGLLMNAKWLIVSCMAVTGLALTVGSGLLPDVDAQSSSGAGPATRPAKPAKPPKEKPAAPPQAEPAVSPATVLDAEAEIAPTAPPVASSKHAFFPIPKTDAELTKLVAKQEQAGYQYVGLIKSTESEKLAFRKAQTPVQAAAWLPIPTSGNSPTVNAIMDGSAPNVSVAGAPAGIADVRGSSSVPRALDAGSTLPPQSSATLGLPVATPTAQALLQRTESSEIVDCQLLKLVHMMPDDAKPIADTIIAGLAAKDNMSAPVENSVKTIERTNSLMFTNLPKSHVDAVLKILKSIDVPVEAPKVP